MTGGPYAEGDARRRLAAIADPTGLAILSRLRIEPATFREMAGFLDVEPSRVRHGLRMLRAADQIAAAEKTRRSGRAESLWTTTHRVDTIDPVDLTGQPSGLVDLAYLQLLRAMFHEVTASLDTGGFSRPNFGVARFPIPLDDRGIEEALDLHRRYMTAMTVEFERAEDRLAASGEQSIMTSGLALLFEYPLEGWPGPVLDLGSGRRGPASHPIDRAPILSAPLGWKLSNALTVFPASAGELAGLIEAPIEKVRYELKRLLAAGLVRVLDTRPNRGAGERIFVAEPRRAAFVAEDVARYRGRRKEDFLRAAARAVFTEALETIGDDRPPRCVRLSRLPMEIDAAGLVAISTLVETLTERLFALRERCIEALGPGEKPAHLAISGSAFFERPATEDGEGARMRGPDPTR